MNQTSPAPIHREAIKESERCAETAKRFGVRWVMVESFLFDSAASLSEDYDGGYWDFVALSHGGFYCAPRSDERFRVACD